jgi:TPR repeat protein
MQLIAIMSEQTDASRETLTGVGIDLALANWLAAAADGDTNACFDLGVAYSTGSNGAECDLVEAHKWFNLAAARGHHEAAHCRADISDEMTAREIAEAQRRARRWLAQERLRAA